jgi:hypothetical protein
MNARRRLPQRRASESFEVNAAGLRYTATVSRFEDGRIGEIFLSSKKPSSQADTNARDAAVICSIALQHNVPINVIRHALLRDAQGRASSPLGAALDKMAGAAS